MPVPRWKPQANTAPPTAAALTNEYRSVITSNGFVTLTDALATIAFLPGIPDTLEAHVIDNPAIITVNDAQGRDGREITLSAGTSTSTLPRNRWVSAKNQSAGNVAKLQLIARYL